MTELSYHDVIDLLHQTLYPRTYLEIGIRHGDCLTLAMDGTKVVGIDPDPQILVALPPDLTIERCTSDEFFASDRALVAFDGIPVDLAFIDGMHHFEFALRDFLNTERICHEGSVILLHDCLPNSAAQAGRTQGKGMWTGDVWKVLSYLRDERPDLKVQILDVGPTGLAVVQGLNPGRPDPDLVPTIARYADLQYDTFLNDLKPSMNLIGGQWDDLRKVFPGAPWQPARQMPELVALRAARQPAFAARVLWARRAFLRTWPGRGVLRIRSSLRARLST